MSNEDHQTPSGPFRRLAAMGLVAALVLVALLVAALVIRGGDDDVVGTAPTLTPSSSEAVAPSSTVNPRAEIVARLREILRIRDKAFRDRDAKVLNNIYTSDCPCLEGDRNAIRELQTKNYNIVGGATSIRVRRVERVSGRLWLVIADFRSAPVRVESEEEKLIREEPAGSDLFQFAMSKPTDSNEWLLGRAMAYQEG
jgi:hypothetical protein